jgi:hypothetical protein
VLRIPLGKIVADPHTPLYLIKSITHIRVAKLKKIGKGMRANQGIAPWNSIQIQPGAKILDLAHQ